MQRTLYIFECLQNFNLKPTRVNKNTKMIRWNFKDCEIIRNSNGGATCDAPCIYWNVGNTWVTIHVYISVRICARRRGKPRARHSDHHHSHVLASCNKIVSNLIPGARATSQGRVRASDVTRRRVPPRAATPSGGDARRPRRRHLSDDPRTFSRRAVCNLKSAVTHLDYFRNGGESRASR